LGVEGARRWRCSVDDGLAAAGHARTLRAEDCGVRAAYLDGARELLLILAVLTWLVGGNAIIAWHRVRRGERWSTSLRPVAFPFRHLTPGEWVALALCGVLALTLAMTATPGAGRPN